MLISASHKVELTATPALTWLSGCCAAVRPTSPLGQSGQEPASPTQKPTFALESLEGAGGALLSPGHRGLTAQSFDQSLLKSVGKSFSSLSPVSINEQNWCFTEIIATCFLLTSRLDNEVKMTLSLIKVICRNH